MRNEIVFLLCAAVTLAGAVAAMMLRNLVHCALCAAGAFAGLAAIYLQLNAEFVGFAQLLIYVGAIAIFIVFTVLLTRGADIQPGSRHHFAVLVAGIAGRRAGFGLFDWVHAQKPQFASSAPRKMFTPRSNKSENN